MSSLRCSAVRTGLLPLVMMEFHTLTTDELDETLGLNWPRELHRRAKRQCEQYLREGISAHIIAGCEAETVRGFVVAPAQPSAVVSCAWPVSDSQEVVEKLARGVLHAIRLGRPAAIVTLLENQTSTETANCESLNGFEKLTTICRYQLEQSALDESSEDNQHSETLRNAPLDDSETRTILERTMHDSLDCPELHAFLSWDERLADFRRLSSDQIRVEIKILEGAHGPLGIALTTTDLQRLECEVNYLGILPEIRGQGWGRVLLKRLLNFQFVANVNRIGVNVDSRNIYAINVYETSGFLLKGKFPLWISLWDALL